MSEVRDRFSALANKETIKQEDTEFIVSDIGKLFSALKKYLLTKKKRNSIIERQKKILKKTQKKHTKKKKKHKKQTNKKNKKKKKKKKQKNNGLMPNVVARNQYHSARKIYNKQKSELNKHFFRTVSKTYKCRILQCIRKTKEDRIKKIKTIKISNFKEYWKYLNSDTEKP